MFRVSDGSLTAVERQVAAAIRDSGAKVGPVNFFITAYRPRIAELAAVGTEPANIASAIIAEERAKLDGDVELEFGGGEDE